MGTLGTIHTGFAVAALVCGAVVVCARKGGRRRRALGHLYLGSMLVTNSTALLLHNLTGRFNIFHASALASLATLAVGMVPAPLRRPRGRWWALHAHGVSGSYVGLVAAAPAEVAVRLVGDRLWVAVGTTTIVVVGSASI